MVFSANWKSENGKDLKSYILKSIDNLVESSGYGTGGSTSGLGWRVSDANSATAARIQHVFTSSRLHDAILVYASAKSFVLRLTTFLYSSIRVSFSRS